MAATSTHGVRDLLARLEESDSAYLLAEKGQIVGATSAATALFGRSRNQLRGMRVSALADEADRDRLEQLSGGRRTGTFEMLGRDARGRVLWLEMQLSRLPGDPSRDLLRVRDRTGDRDVQAELRERANRLRLFADASFEAHLVNDGERILDIDANGEQLSGYRREQLLGLPMVDLVHPDDRQKVRDYIESGRTDAYEIRFLRRDGMVRWAEVRARPATFHGRPARVAVLRDVTEQKEGRRELERFRLWAEHATDMLAVHREDGSWVWVSPSSRRILGYEPEELMAIPPLEVFHPDDAPRAARMGDDLTQDGDLTTLTARVRRRDGAWRWVESTAHPFTEPTTGERLVLAITRDVTERVQAEQAVTRRSRELELLHRASLAATECHDVDDALQRIVTEACRLVEWQAGHVWTWQPPPDDHLVPTGIWYLDDPVRRAPLRHATEGLEFDPGDGLIGATFTTGTLRVLSDAAAEEGLVRHEAADAADLHAAVAVPVSFEGNVLAVLEFYRERVGEPDEHDAELLTTVGRQVGQVLGRRRHLDALARSHHHLERFAAQVAHDLRAPLRAIVGWSRLLDRNAAEQVEGVREPARKMVDSAVRLDRLVDRVLKYAAAIRIEETTEGADAGEVMEEVVQTLRGPIEQNEAEVRWERLPTVAIGPVPLAQLLQNLVSNALTHRGELPPRVDVRARRLAHRWLFEVEDNGRGIPPDDQERIFEPFQRGEVGAESGSGLGLALCREIVEQHGGWIEVRSRPGVGSTFVFSLPALEG